MNACSEKRQIEFLTNLQRLLSEGSFVATYKYALLLSLADIAVASADNSEASLKIPTKLIAEYFIRYYWRQATPFTVHAGILRQNSGKPAKVITVVNAARNRFDGSIAKAQRQPKQWRTLVSRVEANIKEMPLWKLQTVGTSGRLEFLYENKNEGDYIILKPGVAHCFRKHYSLAAELIKGAWALNIQRKNEVELGGYSDLHGFLFGTERVCLAKIQSILTKMQCGKCFYCRKQIADNGNITHVDHFIPWSRYPVDLGHNFVIAHRKCNTQKADFLAATCHVNAWMARNLTYDKVITDSMTKIGVVCDLRTTIRVAEWAYRQTEESRGLTWVNGKNFVQIAA